MRIRPSPVKTEAFGFLVHRDQQRRMEIADQHNEIEINYIESGEMKLHRGSQVHTITSGSFVIYWAAVPHQVIAVKPNTRITWCIVPITWFLAWKLMPRFHQSLLEGNVLTYTRESAHLTVLPFADWAKDFASQSEELRLAVKLEMEAFFRRLAARHAPRAKSVGREHQYGHVERMVNYAIQHFREPLTTTQIAAAVGLNPEYAMRLFREHWGGTLWNFLLQQRVAEAMRLLLVSDATTAQIAFECGFQSLSRFYEIFRRQCHCSPAAYRRRQRG